MSELRTDFKDEILQEGETHRVYDIKRKGTDEIVESDIYLEKAYTPLQEGNEFGAKEVNEIHGRLNGLAPQNLLVNGDFKIWQRGEAITVQGNGGKSYTADMWEIRNQRNSAAQMVHQKTDEGKGTGFRFPGLGSMRIYQWFPIEKMRQYDGQYMTRVWSVNKQVHSETFLLNLSASDGAIEGDKWRAFYYLSNSDDVLNYAALYPGKIAYPHVEEDDAIALLRCQGYHRILPIQFYGFANAGIQVFLEYIINMKDIPTVTLTNGTLSNLTNVRVNKVDKNRLRLSGVVTREGMYSMLDGKAEVSCEPL